MSSTNTLLRGRTPDFPIHEAGGTEPEEEIRREWGREEKRIRGQNDTSMRIVRINEQLDWIGKMFTGTF